MVIADIAGKPVEQGGEFVEGAPLHGGGGVIPFPLAAPIGVLELVLAVKEPDPEAAGDCGDRHLNPEEIPEPEEEADAG